jgi:hypothetical protein
MLGKPKVSPGGEIGIAVGAHNLLRFSGFQAQASGQFTTPIQIQIPGQTYAARTLVSTNYRLFNLRISYEYLTWPFPVESRRFRLRTLWQVQLVKAKNTFNAPNLPTTDSSGNPLVGSSGSFVNYEGGETREVVLPTFGLGATEYLSKNLRLEFNGSGFAIPRRSTIWDSDATINFRLGHVELRVGAKAFHFKTSTGQLFYSRATMASAFAGIRLFVD